MKCKTLVLAMASLLICHVYAADEPVSLDEVVVTAMRTAQTADESLQPVTVIGRAQIEQSQASNLLDLLNMQPGINIGRTGGEGKGASVYMRGTFARHVLVLVDGVRAASATTGEYDWNALSPEQIERIEVVRGPRASLYGSDAVGGVIQIFTRKANGPAINAMLGSHGMRSLNAATGGGEAVRYSIEVGHYQTDGIPNFADEHRRYGFDRDHASLGIEGELSKTLGVAFRFAESRGRNVNDVYTGDNDYRNRTASLRFTQQRGTDWKQQLTLGQTLDSYTSYSPYTPAKIETHRQSVSWQHDLNIQQALLSLGIDHWDDHATKDRSGDIDQNIGNTGFFAQYQFDALGSDWQLGARRDRHDVFGDRNTWNLGWGRDLGSGLRLLASYATAFKAPSVNDFFWPLSTDYSGVYDFLGSYYSDTYNSQGNPALRPETSRNAEVGLRYQTPTLRIAANLYEMRVRDLIEWTSDAVAGGGSGTSDDPVLTTYNWYPANISSARIRGLELTAATQIFGWDWQAGFTRLLATNLQTGHQLDRRPENSLSLRASRAFGPHHLRIEAEGYSWRNDSSGATTLPGYGLLHAGYEYTASRDVTFGLRLENLLNQDYALARTYTRYYATPGRSVFVSLRYVPK